MASLKPSVRLTTFTEKTDAVPVITISLEQQHIIATSCRRNISTWDVASKKLLLSWSVRSSQQISGGAVPNVDGQNFVAVIDQQTLHTWGPEDKSIEKSKKSSKRLKLPQAVHGLYTARDGGVVLVYTDGRVALLTSPDRLHGAPHQQPIRQVDVVKHQGHLVVTVAYSSEIVVYTWTQQNQEPHVTCLQTKTRSSIMCHCLHKSQGELYCLQLDSSGVLWQTSVCGSHMGDGSRLHAVPDLQNAASMASLGESYVVVTGITIAGQGGTGIWDLKFGLLQVWQPFPDGVHSATQLLVTSSQLVLASAQGIYFYPYKNQLSTLGAALGKFAGYALQEFPSSLSQIIKDLADHSKTPSLQSFTAQFQAFLSEPDLQEESALLLIQQPLCQLWHRCLHEKSFWPRDQIHELICRGLVPHSVQSEIFESLVERKEYRLLHTSLSHLSDTPETALISVLICFLCAEEAALLGHFDKEMVDGETDEIIAEIKSPFSMEKSAFVNHVLAQPFNDVFMLQCLRKLNIDQTLVLLGHLQFLLYQVPLTSSHSGPSLVKVVDWLNLVLDAHFSQLVLTQEAHKSLLALHQSVESQVKLYDELVSLEAVLSQLKSRCVLPQKQNPGLYNIHVLHVF